jgi:3-hydroxybutyryl-CoA dehydrogenase
MTDEKPAGLPDVAVVGAGLMGHGIAQVFALAGSRVRIWDPDEATLRAVPDRVQGHLEVLGIDRPAPIELAPSLETAVAGSELVIEAVPERLSLKQELLSRLDSLAPDALIATNTSVLRITEIARGSIRPERVVGTHWWNPPYAIPIVEVVRGDHTAAETVAKVTTWLLAAGKTPVSVNWDAPGFIGNRMQFALWREALSIVEQGICDAETVDLVARNTFGARLATVGPVENADFIGLDLSKAILDYLSPHLSTAASASPLITGAVERGELGAKSGAGLLDWSVRNRAEVESRLLAHLLEQFPDGAPH